MLFLTEVFNANLDWLRILSMFCLVKRRVTGLYPNKYEHGIYVWNLIFYDTHNIFTQSQKYLTSLKYCDICCEYGFLKQMINYNNQSTTHILVNKSNYVSLLLNKFLLLLSICFLGTVSFRWAHAIQFTTCQVGLICKERR